MAIKRTDFVAGQQLSQVEMNQVQDNGVIQVDTTTERDSLPTSVKFCFLTADKQIYKRKESNAWVELCEVSEVANATQMNALPYSSKFTFRTDQEKIFFNFGTNNTTARKWQSVTVPERPVSNTTHYFLRGDNTWQVHRGRHATNGGHVPDNSNIADEKLGEWALSFKDQNAPEWYKIADKYSLSGHTHNYSAPGHTHSYAAPGHTHSYASTDHGHSYLRNWGSYLNDGYSNGMTGPLVADRAAGGFNIVLRNGHPLIGFTHPNYPANSAGSQNYMDYFQGWVGGHVIKTGVQWVGSYAWKGYTKFYASGYYHQALGARRAREINEETEEIKIDFSKIRFTNDLQIEFESLRDAGLKERKTARFDPLDPEVGIIDVVKQKHDADPTTGMPEVDTEDEFYDPIRLNNGLIKYVQRLEARIQELETRL